MRDIPGVYNKPFLLKLDRDMFFAKDSILTNGTITLSVIKVYKLTWWRKLRIKLGLKTKAFCVKVIELKEEIK